MKGRERRGRREREKETKDCRGSKEEKRHRLRLRQRLRQSLWQWQRQRESARGSEGGGGQAGNIDDIFSGRQNERLKQRTGDYDTAWRTHIYRRCSSLQLNSGSTRRSSHDFCLAFLFLCPVLPSLVPFPLLLPLPFIRIVFCAQIEDRVKRLSRFCSPQHMQHAAHTMHH